MIASIVPKLSRTRKRDLAAKWLRPYRAATAGGAVAMIRYLDDPDVPCFADGWLKADKDRFHTERAPGAAKKYVFNPQSWVYAFRDSLTAVSVANEWPWGGHTTPGEWWGCKRGATLVTPQHALCSHGGLGVGTEAYPTRFRFVGTDGETYERTAVGMKICDSLRPVTVNGVTHRGDVTILTLDSALPAEVIPVRQIPNHFKFTSRYSTWDGLFVSQSIELDSPAPGIYGEQMGYNPWKVPGYTTPHFPRRHRSMCCILANNESKLGYSVWGGDSGMPLFYGYGTELLFAGFAAGGGGGANVYPKVQSGVTITWEDLINQMIVDADTDAIARESLDALTNLTITIADEIPDLLP